MDEPIMCKDDNRRYSACGPSGISFSGREARASNEEAGIWWVLRTIGVRALARRLERRMGGCERHAQIVFWRGGKAKDGKSEELMRVSRGVKGSAVLVVGGLNSGVSPASVHLELLALPQ